MKTTVAIPCYNAARTIAPVLESVLGQSLPADQILVVDDGSQDESATIAARYGVTLIRHPHNLGLSAARNTALMHATGDVLAYLDADAAADVDWLRLLQSAYVDEGVGGVGGQGVEANIQTLADEWRRLHASQSHGPRSLESVPFLFGLSMSYRTAVLYRVGGFAADLRTNAEDMDIGYRVVDAGYRLVYCADSRVYHQRQDSEQSLRSALRRWYYWAFVVKERNRRSPWTLVAGTLRRLLWSDTGPDLCVRRSLPLARLDIVMARVKLAAIAAAARGRPVS